MPDWLEWVNLGLGIVGALGALGVAILVYQWYMDHRSKRPYVIEFPLGGTIAGGRQSRTVQIEFNVENRRTKDANLTCWLMVPLHEVGSGMAYAGLNNGHVLGLPTRSVLPRGGLLIPSGDARGFIAVATVPESLAWPSVVHVTIIDERPGRHQFHFEKDIPVSEQ